MIIQARDGADLYVETSGTGTESVVVLLHSLGADHHVWDGVSDILAERYQVVMPDARGHGKSDKGGVSLRSQLEDLEDIMVALKIQTAHLVGISMGGVEALAYCEAWPTRITSLTLVDSFSSLGVQGVNWVREKEDQLKTESMEQFARSYTESTLRPSTPAQVRELLFDAVSTVTSQDYLDASRACFLADLDAVLPHVAVPTLVLIGSHDKRTPLELSQHLATRIPGAELDIVPNAGHLSSMDNPRFVGERICRFIDAQ